MRVRSFFTRGCLLFAACMLLAACALCNVKPAPEAAGRCSLVAEPWPAADRLFREDPRWLGGDGATSVDLGGGRVLWLFGDSFVCGDGHCGRRDAAIVRNTVAIQSGYDPSSATITFYHGSEDNAPASFFPERDDAWFWPGGGVLVEGRLLVFLMEVREADNELGFDAAGWSAVVVENPNLPPAAWKFTEAKIPAAETRIIIGSAAVLREGDYLYAFAVHAVTHDVFLVRWPAPSAAAGDLSRPAWWTGSGWEERNPPGAAPAVLFPGGQMEFTVHREARCGKYMQIQTQSIADASLAVRLADRLTGPWSDPVAFFAPGQAKAPGLLVYAGEAQPALGGADVVLTYNVNTMDVERLYDDRGLYFPFFLKGTVQRGTPP